MTQAKPLVLDVDGTFLKTDMLFECFWAGLGRKPVATLQASMRHFRAPARLKAELAQIAQLRTDLLPVHPEIAQLATSSSDAGREVLLASASDQGLVQRLANDHDLGPEVLASDGQTNLKSAAKAQALVERYGAQGFDYAGNSKDDLAVWEQAENALVVGSNQGFEGRIGQNGRSVTIFDGGWRKRDLIRALRPHQWVKNILLLLPALAAHQFELGVLALVLIGMAVFSAAASAIYIINDLLDLEADRLHPKKRHRPFAAGTVPIQVGMITSGLLGIGALGVAACVSAGFLWITALYMFLSLAYSLRLKRLRWADICILAALYSLRVMAGAAVSGILVSWAMLAFIYPVFLTLGAVKRMTELTLATSDERLPGRGYGRPDRGALLNLSVLGMIGALGVFFLYSLSAQAQYLYPAQWLLWVAMVPLAAWLFRMVRLGYYGKQDYDPIVFALRDKRGLGLIMITLSLMFYAAGLWDQWLGLSG